MRPSLLAIAACLLVLPAGLCAQTAGKLHITGIRIGFPAAADPSEPADDKGRTFLFKAGTWAPVAIDVEAGPEGTAAPAQVTVETSDSDEMQNRFHCELPQLKPSEQSTVVAYVRAGSLNSAVHVTIAVGKNQAEATKRVDAVEIGDVLYLTLGSRLPGMREVLWHRDDNNPDASVPTGFRAAAVEKVTALPTRWFGYDSVDQVFLPTGDRPFVTSLIEDHQGRKEALAEWVRRGGKLLISAGHNHELAARLLRECFPEPTPLALEITGRRQANRVQELERLHPGKRLPAFVQQPDASGRVPLIDLANLGRHSGQAVEVLLPRQGNDPSQALVARAPYGLGQVTMVDFDLDRAPFARWGGQDDFWTSFLRITHAPSGDNTAGDLENREDLASQLQNRLEQFDDVPVISFGWVALLIFLYILVIGPLDYFILKKVIGRLEFTWLTFPVLVLSISGVVCFAVYALKGHELRINKVDVVDVDLQNGQTYGHTWFTLYSPKIQRYAVGIEPAAPTWAAQPRTSQDHQAALISWLGRPDNSYGGYGRARTQGLFQRAYDYEPDAAGLRDVPIQVWATKSFTASWHRSLDPQHKPVTVTLHHGGPEHLVGTVTNNLPIALDDVALIWGSSASTGSVFRVGHLAANETKSVSLRAGENTQRLSDWAGGFQTTGSGTDSTNVALSPAEGLMRRILFQGQAAQQEKSPNVVLSQLDQSWRTHLLDQVMMFARIPTTRYEGVPAGSPDPRLTSLLRLGDIPGKEQRPGVAGMLVQDTYLRFYIPVESNKQKQVNKANR